MHERYVTSPDGTKWVVGRRWLFGRPRYRGFTFGKRRQRSFQPPRRDAAAGTTDAASFTVTDKRSTTVTDEPSTTTPHRVRRSRPMADTANRKDRRAVYRDMDDDRWLFASGYWRQHRPARGWKEPRTGRSSRTAAPRSTRRTRRSSRRPSIFTGGWALSGSSGGGGRGGGASGGRARGASGGSGRGSSGGGGRGQAGAAAGGGVAALGPVLGAALKWILIIAVVAALAAFTIFIALPFLLFLLQLAVVGLIIVWRELTGRPYIVEARENRAAPKVYAWKVVGLKQSRKVIDDVAESLRRNITPQPANAEPVTLSDD